MNENPKQNGCARCGKNLVLHLSVYKNYKFYCCRACADGGSNWLTNTYADGRKDDSRKQTQKLDDKLPKKT